MHIHPDIKGQWLNWIFFLTFEVAKLEFIPDLSSFSTFDFSTVGISRQESVADRGLSPRSDWTDQLGGEPDMLRGLPEALPACRHRSPRYQGRHLEQQVEGATIFV